MKNNDVSRREVLGSVGAAGVGALVLGTETVEAQSPDRHIVGCESKAATNAAKRKADSVYRVIELGQYPTAVAGVFPEQVLEQLKRRSDVEYVEEDITLETVGQTLPWGIDRVDADRAHANGETGGDDGGDGGDGDDDPNGADIAIVDTGIDPDHPDLKPNLGKGKAFASGHWDDDNGHGTHVAGIADAVDNSEGVVGVSTRATLHAVQVCNGGGMCSASDIAAGLEWAADQGYDVANLSLGGGYSETIDNSGKYAYDKGVLLVAAAGNDGPCSDCVSYPAANEEFMAVSATTSTDSLAGFSSTGPEVELAAPGKDIYSTYDGGGYETLSGTSMASPHVAGAGGQLMDNGYANATQSSSDAESSDPYPSSPGGARSQLQDTAEDVGLTSDEQGEGLVDVEAALGLGGLSVDSLSVTEDETSDGDAEFDASWSVSDPEGELDTLELVLYDTTAGSQDDSATPSVSGDKASGTTHLVASGDEASGHSYDVTATVTDADGNTASKTVSTSETEDTPTVDSLSLSEVETSDSDAEFDADWQVSDNDGDLSSVDLILTDTDDGETEDDPAAMSVSGDSASGTTRLVASGEDGSGHTYEVTATVSDTDGTTGSDKATATEGESSGSSSDMYVHDPTFDEKSYGPGGSFDDLMTTVTIRQDSDADGTAESSDDPVENATVDMTLSVDTNGDGSYDDGSWSFSGDTDSNGQIEFTLKKAPDGDYEADITNVTHSTYSWDSSLDVEEPDYYCNFPGGSEC
ncbi:MAG: S8 family serine peptidase [Haloferacaceae archaeon]